MIRCTDESVRYTTLLQHTNAFGERDVKWSIQKNVSRQVREFCLHVRVGSDRTTRACTGLSHVRALCLYYYQSRIRDTNSAVRGSGNFDECEPPFGRFVIIPTTKPMLCENENKIKRVRNESAELF